jgi:hypothetical protein
MPSTVASVMAAAGLGVEESVSWGSRVSSTRPGIYVVALTPDPRAAPAERTPPPISQEAVARWLNVRPELRMDGARPTVHDLAHRLADFWLGDESVLYIGLTTRPLRKRVNEYYKTPLGAEKPHAGGHFLKTLSNLHELWVHVAPCTEVRTAEDTALTAFCASVSQLTKARLRDPERPFPFANLEWPPGNRRRHGLSGTKGPVAR